LNKRFTVIPLIHSLLTTYWHYVVAYRKSLKHMFCLYLSYYLFYFYTVLLFHK